MFSNLIKKLQTIELKDFNNIILLISLIILGTSFFFLNNIYILIFIYLGILYLFTKRKRKVYLNLVMGILPIIILAFILLQYLDLSFFRIDILKGINIFLKGCLYIVYCLIVFTELKNKEIKYIKLKKGKRTFNDLRIKNIKRYKEANLDLINKYQKDNNLALDSDYYKIIKENLGNKTKIDLEEYVVLNYLRFYKNKKVTSKIGFDKLNIVFLVIHVIILLLAILMR